MPERKLLDRVSDIARLRHLSLRTEETYRSWIKRFILFHDKRHPKDLDAQAVRTFLTHLAVQEHVAASTQNQAFNALLFLYKQVPALMTFEAGNLDILAGISAPIIWWLYTTRRVGRFDAASRLVTPLGVRTPPFVVLP